MKVFLRTYGCRANRYDTEAVRGMLAAAGAQEVTRAEEADYAIFNSCTVTAAAEVDLRADIRKASRANANLKSVVMGCAPGVVARDETVAPLRSLPGVDHLIAGANIAEVQVALGLPPSSIVAPAIQTGARALLRIQEGCDEHCTFCATTMSRGGSRSRPVQDLIQEAQLLAGSHPEIVLTGIHIGSYGRDIGTTLASLVEHLVAATDHVRFRLTSIEATEVDDKLAVLMTTSRGRVAPHLHAPLQSGSDRVLRRMGRHWYTAREYEEGVLRIADACDVFALSGDVISGFPGETEEDHAATVDLVTRLPFTALHVFPYSPRPGTAALKLGGVVTQSVATRRSAELRRLANLKSRQYSERRDGGTGDVVVTGRGAGLTEDYLSVDVLDPSVPRRARFNARLDLIDGRLTALPEPSTAE